MGCWTAVIGAYLMVLFLNRTLQVFCLHTHTFTHTHTQIHVCIFTRTHINNNMSPPSLVSTVWQAVRQGTARVRWDSWPWGGWRGVGGWEGHGLTYIWPIFTPETNTSYSVIQVDRCVCVSLFWCVSFCVCVFISKTIPWEESLWSSRLVNGLYERRRDKESRPGNGSQTIQWCVCVCVRVVLIPLLFTFLSIILFVPQFFPYHSFRPWAGLPLLSAMKHTHRHTHTCTHTYIHTLTYTF